MLGGNWIREGQQGQSERGTSTKGLTAASLKMPHALGQPLGAIWGHPVASSPLMAQYPFLDSSQTQEAEEENHFWLNTMCLCFISPLKSKASLALSSHDVQCLDLISGFFEIFHKVLFPEKLWCSTPGGSRPGWMRPWAA